MSDGITEDHWKRRYEELECQMNEKVGKLEELFTNAISQINALTLERNNAKEAAAAANARRIGAKAGKKKGKTKGKKSAGKHRRTGKERPADIDREATADASVCDVRRDIDRSLVCQRAKVDCGRTLCLQHSSAVLMLVLIDSSTIWIFCSGVNLLFTMIFVLQCWV